MATQTSYLERYLAGEREQVWDELVALGEQVREEPLYSDALAVARETMRRVRYNIEHLIPRLIAVGYQFGYGWVQPFARERFFRPFRADLPGQRGAIIEPAIPELYTYGYRVAYEDYLEMAEHPYPLFVPANDREERIANHESSISKTAPSQEKLRDQIRGWIAELAAQPSAHDKVEELEESLGILPLSVRAWYEEVGSVNFVGDHPGWRELLPEGAILPESEFEYLNPMYMLDPLVIRPLDGVLADVRDSKQRHWVDPSGRKRSSFFLAPGEWMKYLDNGGIGGTYWLGLIVPAPVADKQVVTPRYRKRQDDNPSTQMFVPYLRESFRWGGFRGWARLEKRPDEDLAFLTQGLQPI